MSKSPLLLALVASFLVACNQISSTGNSANAGEPSTRSIKRASWEQSARTAFGERKGHVVAIDSESGEVLVNATINGPTAEAYAPGSTIKPFLALAGLQLGKRQPDQTFDFHGAFQFGGFTFADLPDRQHGPINLRQSLVLSSDTYYFSLVNDLGIDALHDFLGQFGFGEPTGLEKSREVTWILPSPAWKREHFKDRPENVQRWSKNETISLGNGHGWIKVTPAQMARATAAIANGGRVYRLTPDAATTPLLRRTIQLTPAHLDLVRDALRSALIDGAAQASFRNASLPTAGKTGAANVWVQKTGGDAKSCEDNPDACGTWETHAWFTGYAPYNHPKVAIAVVVEHGGPGYTSAAPIAHAIFDAILSEKPITGRVPVMPKHSGPAND